MFYSPCISGLALMWSLVTVLRTDSFPSLFPLLSISFPPGPSSSPLLPVGRSTGVRSWLSVVGLICLWKALKSMSICLSLSRPKGRGWAVTDGKAWSRENAGGRNVAFKIHSKYLSNVIVRISICNPLYFYNSMHFRVKQGIKWEK